MPGASSSDKETTDKVFLLSLKEAQKYGIKYRSATPYAVACGALEHSFMSDGEHITTWFLRDPKQYTGMVKSDYWGGDYAVCPAMWVALGK